MSVDLALVFVRLKYPSGDPPLGVASIAAAVREAGYTVDIVDTTWHRSLDWAKGRISEMRPDMVGIYVGTLMVPAVQELARWSRAHGYPTVLGGPHITIDGKGFEDSGCTLIKGEGENAVISLLDGHREAVTQPDLAKLPAPALDLLEMDKYISHFHYLDPVMPGMSGTTLMSSRGCPMMCSFCQPTLDKIFGKKLRHRPSQLVADEMAELHDRYGISGFFFQDDNFTTDHGWMRELFACMVKLKFFPIWGCNSRIDTVDDEILNDMAVSGCRNIHYGVESGNQGIIDNVYHKKIKLDQVRSVLENTQKWRISTSAFFILGAPREGEEEIQQTIDFALSLPLDEASFSLCVPLPGTHMYDELDRAGLITSYRPESYDYYKTRPFSLLISTGKVRSMRRDALLRFYWKRKGYLLSHLTSANGIKHLVQKVTRSW